MTVSKLHMKFIFTGLMLGILMAAMDSTIVTTSMGTIVGDLGGLDKFVLVSSVYMIAELAGMPIFGKLSDMYGRKRFFIFGISIFIIGSLLCVTAQTMDQLILYRTIQGIGGGALIPIAFTIMYDLVPVEGRGKLGGMFGAVFGLASIFGPLLGAFITDHINWHWIFLINVPLGIVAFIFVVYFYKESHEHSKQKIDWWGAVTLVSAIVTLMLVLKLGGTKFAWNSLPIVGLCSLFVVLGILIYVVEKRAAEPIITLRMFASRLYSTSNAIAVFAGAAFVTSSIYIPIYIQGVLGGTATDSGMVLLPMMLSTVVTSTIGGFLMNKWSYRAIMIPSMIMFAAGLFLLSTLTPQSSHLMVTLYLSIVGLGIGFSFSVLGNSSIHPFNINQRGSASSTFSFLRALGMTIGITVFGIVQNHYFISKMAASSESSSGSLKLLPKDPHALLDPAQRSLLPSSVLDIITQPLSSSITLTFAWTLVPASIAVIASFMMSSEKLITVETVSKETPLEVLTQQLD
ncbi:MDR family MFS transporter [Paenibacillus sp. An7]|uniref:MDR family MFS transporter n=1 Tax=Paenibacillus sp. An7 TaxID=2689577 RepID=UPI001357D928|nr:MDR family MFS transporter [Paenibacillus sp. An7]